MLDSASSKPPISKVRSRDAITPDPPPGTQFWRSSRSATAGSRGGVSQPEIWHCASMFTDPVQDHPAEGSAARAPSWEHSLSGAHKSSSSTKAVSYTHLRAHETVLD